jgi:predicted acyltransferase
MEKTKVFKNPRLDSLDALRGFDMFWIMGMGELLERLAKEKGTVFWDAIALQFSHPVWNGVTFWDTIFPLFMFMAGVSTPYSIGRELEKGTSRRALLMRVLKRGFILVLIGVVYNNGLQLHPISEIRFPSVLGKIGATYMLANIIYLYAGRTAQIVWFWAFLIGYWLLLKFTSAPGFPQGDLTEPGNFMSYLDRSILPGRLSRGIHDTVGLVCTIPGISTVMAGIFAGVHLKYSNTGGGKKAAQLAITGILSLVLGWIWSIDFPFNKNLWSSSFVLFTTGYSLLMLAVFYYIIDVKGYKRWTFFFRVIGMNSILIYISPIFINWDYTANGFFKWLAQLTGPTYGSVVLALCAIGIEWLFLYFLYKKKAFLRV